MLREAIGADVGIVDLTAEGHQGAKRIALLLDVLIDGQLPAHGLLAGTHHHHRLGLALQQGPDELAEMLHHDLYLLGDVVGVELHPAHQLLEGGAALHLLRGEVVAVLGELEGHLVGGVVLEHIKDEALLDRLAHRIHVERRRQVARAGGLIEIVSPAEELQRFGLGGGGEGHIGDAGLPGPGAHLGRQQGFDINLAAIGQIGHLSSGEHLLELVGCGAGLGAVGLIGDHREALAAGGGELLHLLDQGREGLDRANHDLLVTREGRRQLLALDSLLGGD